MLVENSREKVVKCTGEVENDNFRYVVQYEYINDALKSLVAQVMKKETVETPTGAQIQERSIGVISLDRNTMQKIVGIPSSEASAAHAQVLDEMITQLTSQVVIE